MSVKHLLLLPLAFLCTGCISMTVEQVINADSTGSFAIEMDMSGMIEFMEELAQASGEELAAADITEFETQLSTACDEPEFKNLSLADVNAEIDDELGVEILSFDCKYLGNYTLKYGATFALEQSDTFSITKLANGGTQYRLSSTSEQVAEAYNFEDFGMNPDEFGEFISMSFRLKMPGIITSATAGTINGDTLTIDNLYTTIDLTRFEVTSVLGATNTTQRSNAATQIVHNVEVKEAWQSAVQQRTCQRFLTADLPERVRVRKIERLNSYYGINCL
jgi:hypothetical protein